MTNGVSIYEHICAYLDSEGHLEDRGQRLPDEDKVMSGSIKWVAGAMDGVFGHHSGGGATERAARTAKLLMRASKRPSARNLRQLYAEVADDTALDIVDHLMEELARHPSERHPLHDVGRWLATTAIDRGAVKVGLAVLGMTGAENDVDVLRALGAHDEFTLYVAVALRNSLEHPDRELWAVARAVNGWGRIQCVERLRATTDPEIRAWLLREGFRNSIMNEYLAFTAATTGRLLDALQGDDLDRGLLTAAGEIFEALVAGGPAEDMDDYDDGADATEAYLVLMGTRAETLDDFHAVAAIRSFLAQETDWDSRSAKGWTASRREAFESSCDMILGLEEWADRIAVALLSDDDAEFWRADQAARTRGIDTFDLHVPRIRDRPLEGFWYQAWEQADDSRAEQLADLARSLLPLDEIATGPSDETGMGPEWRLHTALDWTLQALRHHVGVGSDLVMAGLHSPVVRNRNMSLNALKCWPASSWPAEAHQVVKALAHNDPNPKTREFAAEVGRHDTASA